MHTHKVEFSQTRKTKSLFFSTVFAALVAAVTSTTALAQGGLLLEEVIVTAQKREQSVQDVGISMTTFTGDQLEALGFGRSTDVAYMTPGVYVNTNTGGQNQQFTIRGVGQSDFLDGLESPNSVYVDEGYITMMNFQLFGMYDLERVEVLKGPQGTLFGRNATGGLVHYITRKPTFDEVEGYVKTTYGEHDWINVEAAAGGPLSETVAGRLAVYYNYFDEIWENLYPLDAVNIGGLPAIGGEDSYNDNTWAVRGHLLFEPNEDMSLLVSGNVSQTEVGTPPAETPGVLPVFDAQGRQVNAIFASPTETREAVGPGGVGVPISFLDNEVPAFLLPFFPFSSLEDNVRPTPGGDLLGHLDPDPRDLKGSVDFSFDDLNQYDAYGVTANFKWDLGGMNLTSITDWKSYDKFMMLDTGAAAATTFIFFSDSEEWSLSQELRLNGETDNFFWVTGFYYLHIDNETIQGLGTTTTSINGPLYDPFFGPLVTGTGIDLVNVSQKETDSISLFGQIDYDLTDKLTFIAGLRVIFEDKEYELTKNAYYNENDIGIDQNIFHPDGVDVRVPFAEDTSDTLWAGRLQFNYQPNDDWLIYASINRGVKAGDFNSKVFFDLGFPDNLTDDAVGYDEEVLTAYEVGFKSTLFDGTTRLNVSFYYYDYDGYQAATFLDFSSLIANEDAKAKGIEFDLTTSPWEGWDFMFGGSFSDPEITNLAVAPDVFRDVRPPFSPTVMLSGLARYSWQALGGTMAAQMNAYYHGSHFHNIRNFDAHKLDAFTVANARLTWDSADEHWQVAFFVNNLADEKYLIQGFALEQICGCSKDTVGKPRWFGGSVRYQF